MGADGHIMIAKLEDFSRENPGVNPGDLGLYSGTIMGIEACWAYYGEPDYEPNYMCPDGQGLTHKRFEEKWDREKKAFVKRDDSEKLDLEAASVWFDSHAEHHEVWT